MNGSANSSIDVNDLIDRVRSMVLKPKQGWQRLAGENFAIADVYKRYLLVLVALGPVCGALGMSIFGVTIPFVGTFRVPLVESLIGAVTQYVVSLLMVFVASFIVMKVAGICGAKPSQEDSFKLVAFAAFPAYVLGILSIFPPLGILAGLLSLYSVYVFYVGITPILKVAENQRLKLCILSGIGIFIAAIVVALVTAPFQPKTPEMTESPFSSGDMQVEGVDMKEFQKSMEQLEKAFKPQP